jgi:hypothetical protein
MDFDSLISSLLSQGQSAEEVAKSFTETLNKITAANKSKEEVWRYLNDARDCVYAALDGETPFDFRVAAKAQVIAAAAYRPGFTLSQYKEMEDAFLEATKWSVELYQDLVKETPKSMKSWSDDEKLMDFLRKAGLSGR